MALTAAALVNKSLELVSAPTIYSEINARMNDANSSAEDISTIINQDPALSARLLKIVNSPFYGFPSQITTISRAITIIGTRELMHLVLATSVIQSFKGIPSDLIDMDSFWRHSLATAMIAKHIAQHNGQMNTERFFISGLLHNIGALVIYLTLPEMAREALSGTQFHGETICEAEQRVMGFDHTETGAALISAWRLPSSLMEVARYHHTPARAQTYPTEVAIVHIADVLAHHTFIDGHDSCDLPHVDDQAATIVTLTETMASEIIEHVATQLDELTAIMTS